MPKSRPSNSVDGDPSPFTSLPRLPSGFRYERLRNPWHASSPSPTLEPTATEAASATAPPAVGAAPPPPSGTNYDDTAPRTTWTGATAETGASMSQ